MTNLYYCACRCGCTVVLAGKDNPGCTFCMEDNAHKRQFLKDGIDLKNQFNPMTAIPIGED